MQKTIITMPEKKLVGIKTRTNNQTEIDWQTGKIMPCVKSYFHHGLAGKIPHRIRPETTYCVYTEYISDHTGDYTYFIGEEVSSFDGVLEDLKCLTIPAQKYAKFTNRPGAMPQVVREPWFKIWQMNSKDLGGERCYLADFEIYDERASDHNNIILDICIGIADEK